MDAAVRKSKSRGLRLVSQRTRDIVDDIHELDWQRHACMECSLMPQSQPADLVQTSMLKWRKGGVNAEFKRGEAQQIVVNSSVRPAIKITSKFCKSSM